jgi:hypothetical protein
MTLKFRKPEDRAGPAARAVAAGNAIIRIRRSAVSRFFMKTSGM